MHRNITEPPSSNNLPNIKEETLFKETFENPKIVIIEEQPQSYRTSNFIDLDSSINKHVDFSLEYSKKESKTN